MPNNQAVPQKNEDKSRFQITTRSGEKITLDKKTVISYLTSNQDISDSEYTMFFQLCKANKVNPFLKEAYIIKYKGSPATIILDYKVLQQIAEENVHYKGMKHGVIVADKNGNVTERHGEYILPTESLIAGWCEVFRDDRTEPTRVTAMFDEFKALKSNGELNSNWAGKPCFMICKVAKAQALREAFPNLVGSNVYVKEEADTFEQPAPQARGGVVKEDFIDNEPVEDDIPSAPAPKADEDGVVADDQPSLFPDEE